MDSMIVKNIIASFVPLFVAVDAVGILPLFASLTADLDSEEKKRVIRQSTVTALALALGFVLVGKIVFRLLGITMADFMMAGGAILFCLAIIDILHGEKERRLPGKDLGVVPLGTPLIAGPAVLTTSLVSVSQYGVSATIVSVVLNIVVVGLLFRSASVFMRLIGDAGAKALSKVMSLLLGAIAVMLIRRGIQLVVASGN
jgi:multiple antibiotic resistance protein